MDRLLKPSRALIRLVGSLKQKKHRKLNELSTIEGYKLIEEALTAKTPLHSAFFTERCMEDSRELIQKLNEVEVEIFSISPGEMERLSPLKTPPGCLAVYKTDFKPSGNETGFVLGVNKISDPGNLGTIIRTADWFGVSRIFLAEESAELHNPSTVRGSMGAVFRVPIFEDSNLSEVIASLKSEDYYVIVASTRGGNPPHKTDGKVAVLIGDEQGNLPEELKSLADEEITIPRIGNGESLNISIAGGILFYILSV